MVHRRCLEFVKTTNFKNNCVYDENENLETAYAKIMKGLDNGTKGMLQLMPKNTDMTQWMEYFTFCYLVYRHCK